MNWPLLNPIEGLNKIKGGARAVDVRSPGEFATGHVPGFINIAILNDEHRHQVGWTYKNQGNAMAVQLGHQLVDPLRAELVGAWRDAFENSPGLVTCWRGGLRSKIVAEWLGEGGLDGGRLEGGYKALRHVLLEEIERMREWVVVGGLTGSGKTDVLRELPSARVLDLEGMAKHRGSAFGGFLNEPQPAQQTFENAIGLHMFNNPGPLIVEAESAMVGICSVPAPVRNAIRNSPLVRLHATADERVRRVFEEYVDQPLKSNTAELVKQSLLNAVLRIQKTLGGVRTAVVVDQLQSAFKSETVSVEHHRPWIESLLKEYYDPMYEYGLKRDQRKLLFEGHHEAVRGFLQDFIDRRRT